MRCALQITFASGLYLSFYYDQTRLNFNSITGDNNVIVFHFFNALVVQLQRVTLVSKPD